MGAWSSRFAIDLEQEFGHADITSEVSRAVADSGITNGMVTVALVGSTGAITTIEYESGALKDLREALDRLAPIGPEYHHDSRWGDGNGFSHLRSALVKTSIAVPVADGELALGTWQQVIVLNLDNRRRKREVVVSVVGE
ncbi:MAG: secondary thiamine-phosphate synthase enzyme YjbQ [Gemmatimonadales bacterium]